MHQQVWGYKVEEKLYVGVREHKTLNTTGDNYVMARGFVSLLHAGSAVDTDVQLILVRFCVPADQRNYWGLSASDSSPIAGEHCGGHVFHYRVLSALHSLQKMETNTK
jgi:hypothetical protein